MNLNPICIIACIAYVFPSVLYIVSHGLQKPVIVSLSGAPVDTSGMDALAAVLKKEPMSSKSVGKTKAKKKGSIEDVGLSASDLALMGQDGTCPARTSVQLLVLVLLTVVMSLPLVLCISRFRRYYYYSF